MKRKERGTRMKKFIILILTSIFLCGCSMQSDDSEKINDLEFTVIGEDEIPEALLSQVQEKKQEEMKLTYSDEENTYIVRGYGVQQSGGYSISVDELYLTENAIVVKTSLLGPSAAEQVDNTESTPFVIIKMELSDKNVVFE